VEGERGRDENRTRERERAREERETESFVFLTVLQPKHTAHSMRVYSPMFLSILATCDTLTASTINFSFPEAFYLKETDCPLSNPTSPLLSPV
jgi:hypothetical protein